MRTYKIPLSDIRDIFVIACPEWQEKIIEMTKGVNFLREKTVDLSIEIIQEMFCAATTEQLPTVTRVFQEYLKDSKELNPVKVASPETVKKIGDLSKDLFGYCSTLEIVNFAAKMIGRPDLERRALYVNSSLEVVLHDVKQTGGTVIEFRKK